MLPNSTTKGIENFLYSSNSLVGVDPSVSPQQLMFFMKVNLNQMSRPSPASFGQNYTMKIYTNPNIMNVSNLGIDFLAYSASSRAWDSSLSTRALLRPETRRGTGANGGAGLLTGNTI